MRETVIGTAIGIVVGVGILIGVAHAMHLGPFGGSQSIVDAIAELGRPIMAHPDELTIHYDESVSEHDRELVELAVEMARPMFTKNGFELTATIYVAGDKESFHRIDEDVFGVPRAESEKRFASTRGSTNGFSANIQLNHAFYDEKLKVDPQWEGRDSTIVYTAMHELYHVLQTKLSDGWHQFATMDMFSEVSANYAATYAFINAYCVPYTEGATLILVEETVEDCDQDYVNEQMIFWGAIRFFGGDDPDGAVQMYLFDTYGLSVFDDYYREMSKEAETFVDFDAFDESGAAAASQRLYGFDSWDSLYDLVIPFIEENSNALIERMNQQLEGAEK